MDDIDLDTLGAKVRAERAGLAWAAIDALTLLSATDTFLDPAGTVLRDLGCARTVPGAS